LAVDVQFMEPKIWVGTNGKIMAGVILTLELFAARYTRLAPIPEPDECVEHLL